MRRDLDDLHLVRPEHVPIHARLENWSRWQRGGRGGSSALPMFRQYRDGYFELAVTSVPIDERDAVKIQVAFSQLPEKHRHATGWCYVRPGLPVHVVCRILAVRRSALADLIHDSRSMLKNRTTTTCSV